MAKWDHFSPATQRIKGLFVVCEKSIIQSYFDVLCCPGPHVLIEWKINSPVHQPTDLLGTTYKQHMLVGHVPDISR